MSTTAQAMMQYLDTVDGIQYYWAAPGRFAKPGVYFWDATREKNVRLSAELVNGLATALTGLRHAANDCVAINQGYPMPAPHMTTAERLKAPLQIANQALEQLSEAPR